MGDPDTYSDPTAYAALAREQKELEAVVEAYREVKRLKSVQAEWRSSSRISGGLCVTTAGTWPRLLSCATSCSVAGQWQHPQEPTLGQVLERSGWMTCSVWAVRATWDSACTGSRPGTTVGTWRTPASSAQVRGCPLPGCHDFCVSLGTFSLAQHGKQCETHLLTCHVDACQPSGAGGSPGLLPSPSAGAASAEVTPAGRTSFPAAVALAAAFPWCKTHPQSRAVTPGG